MGQLLLVRHGQASWDGADYDVLSEVGHRQGELLGAALAARGIRPELVVTGGMRRHRDCVLADTQPVFLPGQISAPVRALRRSTKMVGPVLTTT